MVDIQKNLDKIKQLVSEIETELTKNDIPPCGHLISWLFNEIRIIESDHYLLASRGDFNLWKIDFQTKKIIFPTGIKNYIDRNREMTKQLSMFCTNVGIVEDFKDVLFPILKTEDYKESKNLYTHLNAEETILVIKKGLESKEDILLTDENVNKAVKEIEALKASVIEKEKLTQQKVQTVKLQGEGRINREFLIEIDAFNSPKEFLQELKIAAEKILNRIEK